MFEPERPMVLFQPSKKYLLAKKPHFAQTFFVMRLFSENCLVRPEFAAC
jgi:hypothetical protein